MSGFERFKGAILKSAEWGNGGGAVFNTCREAYADFCVYVQSKGCIHPDKGAVDDRLGEAVRGWLTDRADGKWPPKEPYNYALYNPLMVTPPPKPAPPEAPAAEGTYHYKYTYYDRGHDGDQPKATLSLKEPRCGICGGEWDEIGRKCWRKCWKASPVRGS